MSSPFRSLLRTSVGLLLTTLAAACGDDTTSPPEPEPLVVPEGCNPIAADHDCLLPFPSDFYRTNGDDGLRVHVPDAALPVFDVGPVDVLAAHRPDGFSIGTPILAVLGAEVDDTSLVFWNGDVSRSLTAESPTMIVDAETGEAVPHFAEIDPRATDPLRQALILRPVVRLEAGRRYVVGLHGIKATDGAVIAAPRGFESLKTEAGKANPLLESMSAHYESDIFPLLEARGLARGDLQLAWDFTTRTDEDAMGDMLAMQQDLRDRLSEAPPEVTLVSVEDDVSDHIARRVELTISVPLYVSSSEVGAVLNGSPPIATEMTEVPVTVWIPPSVMNRAPEDPPARLLQFGHGFFGTRYESNSFASAFADAHGFVIVGADWWGMSESDRNFVAGEFINHPANVLSFTDRLHQGMANFIALAAAAQGPISTLPELQIQGAPAYDAQTLYYYGISNGHILGLTYYALNPDVDRAAFGVGGANYGLMLFRAQPFQPFLALLLTQLSDHLDHQKFGVFAQSIFDRIDPVSYAPQIRDDDQRRYLLQMGIADAAVPNLGSYFGANILGAGLLEGTTEASLAIPTWLETVPSPAQSRALTVFDLGFEPTYEAVAGESNSVHEDVRRLEASQRQIDAFFQPDGVIENPCSGICDPE